MLRSNSKSWGNPCGQSTVENYERLCIPSSELLNDSMRRYLSRMAMSSHIRCCSNVGVGDAHVRSINCTKHNTKHFP